LGVWVNPRVRVVYDGIAYEAVHPHRARAGEEAWLSSWDVFMGLWRNRLLRWGRILPLDRWRVLWKMEEWQRGGRDRVERGAVCVVDEMQVLVANGWAHV
jgi:hypothetical protein